MDVPEAATSPRAYTRVGGALYLIIIVLGLLGEAFVRNKLIVVGDATATANNIRSSPLLWRVSIAAELFMLICGVALVLIFYVLLRPVNRDLALLAVFFNLVSITLEASNKLHLLAVLFPLENGNDVAAFDAAQRDDLAYLSTRSHLYGFGISLIFFGCVCLILGYLIFRSGYLPKLLGILMQVAGLCYLTNSFALILSPAVEGLLFPAILIPAFVGETSLCLWLLIKGVDIEKWKLLASIPPPPELATSDAR